MADVKVTFSVQVTARVYDHESKTEAKPGGLSLDFDTEKEMWEFILAVKEFAIRDSNYLSRWIAEKLGWRYEISPSGNFWHHLLCVQPQGHKDCGRSTLDMVNDPDMTMMLIADRGFRSLETQFATTGEYRATFTTAVKAFEAYGRTPGHAVCRSMGQGQRVPANLATLGWPDRQTAAETRLAGV